MVAQARVWVGAVVARAIAGGGATAPEAGGAAQKTARCVAGGPAGGGVVGRGSGASGGADRASVAPG
ncbi:hypothetical protein Emag_007871 [Eimeria magna]